MPSLAVADYRNLVRRALDEDIGSGDITTNAIVDPSRRAEGVFLAKTDCVLAGIDVAGEAFHLLDATVEIDLLKHDGDRCRAGDRIGAVTGSARALLTGERTALNFLQHLSGIATQAHAFVERAGGRITILDTRKTTPTLRALEKYAVRMGGAANHRIGLYDAILIKDNHIRLAGGVTEAIAGVRRAEPGRPIEIEAETIAQVDEALASGVEIILVDNMCANDVRAAVGRISGRAKVEISGGVRLEQLPELAATGADYVSVGALTHSVAAADISFEITPL
jgi:nicotinate-nucleotide pyrophosphorylase (carboxylating)